MSTSPASSPPAAPLVHVVPDDAPITSDVSVMPPPAPTDMQLVHLWLHGRSVHTQEAYRRDIERLFTFTGKPLATTTLADLHAFDDSLHALAPSSRKRMLSAIKSLLTFAQKTGYLRLNVGAALILPKNKDTIAERILSEAQVQRMLAREDNARNHLLLTLLYATGGRVSEVCRLCWRDCQPTKHGGQVTLYGKGSKTRHVLLKAETFLYLLTIKGDAGPHDPVFRSAKGGSLQRQQVGRIVAAAAKRAGIRGNVSPHWLRHAHVSHALDNGAPAHLVKETVGHASLDTTTRYAHARPTDSSARYLPV